MALAAHDAADRVEQMRILTERLTARLGEECAAFESRRPQDVAPGIAETQRLANAYRHESDRIRAQPALIAGAPLAARRALAAATQAFETVLARHGRAVEAARTLTEGLVQAIASELASGRSNGAGYGAAGYAVNADTRAVALNARA